VSRRVSLKEFQEGLAGRLKAAATETATTSRLGFEAGGELWLLRLEGSGEVLPSPEILRVPLTREWFLGVANVRGVLYGVSDFGAFLGRGASTLGPQNRLLLIGQPYAVNCALLVTRLTGLRSISGLRECSIEGSLSRWTTAAWVDGEDRIWRELDAERLLGNESFLNIAVH